MIESEPEEDREHSVYTYGEILEMFYVKNKLEEEEE